MPVLPSVEEVRKRLPEWAREPTVFEPAWRRPLRGWIHFLGLDDPKSQVLQGALGVPMLAAEGESLLGEVAKKFPRFAKAIKAYHGSPHDFEAFSTAKIGSGEGAQAYGHGLYFAEKEGTAKAYRDALSDMAQVLVDDVPLPHPLNTESPVDMALLDLSQGRADPAAIRRGFTDRFANEYEQAVQKYQGRVKAAKPGKMYEVNIHADPATFLDWDKPLSQQPESVRYLMGYQGRPTQAETDAVYALAKQRGVAPTSLPEYKAQEARLDAAAKLERDYPNGRAIYNEWMNDERNVAIRQGRHADTTLPKSQAAASQALRESGIPGLKYLDQGSRTSSVEVDKFIAEHGSREQALTAAERYLKASEAQGSGFGHWDRMVAELKKPETRNFVVFDDALIQILKKYGVVLPLAGAAGWRATTRNTDGS